jgi:hypothetical protein
LSSASWLSTAVRRSTVNWPSARWPLSTIDELGHRRDEVVPAPIRRAPAEQQQVACLVIVVSRGPSQDSSTRR